MLSASHHPKILCFPEPSSPGHLCRLDIRTARSMWETEAAKADSTLSKVLFLFSSSFSSLPNSSQESGICLPSPKFRGLHTSGSPICHPQPQEQGSPRILQVLWGLKKINSLIHPCEARPSRSLGLGKGPGAQRGWIGWWAGGAVVPPSGCQGPANLHPYWPRFPGGCWWESEQVQESVRGRWGSSRGRPSKPLCLGLCACQQQPQKPASALLYPQ